MSPRTYEEEPAVGDYRRSVSSYDSASSSEDHDLTLGTPTILGLFFALALVCACFFGLGYAMGHRTAPAPQVFDNGVAASTGAAKPAAGSAVVVEPQPATDTASATPDAPTSGAQTATVPFNAPATTALASAPSAVTNAARPSPTTSAAPTSAATGTLTPGNFVVQVAAVSSQDVANILLSTLQKKGYAVSVRHEPQDQLLHVQIGPFPERKDAEAMRQRVIADGFNAIVK